MRSPSVPTDDRGPRPGPWRLALLASALLTGAFALSARPADDGHVSTLAAASSWSGTGYHAEVVHTVTFEANGHPIEAAREVRMDLRMVAAQSDSPAGERIGVVLDRVRAASSAHGSRQVLDTRLLEGSRVDLAYARAGGRPSYGPPLPAVPFPQPMGGSVPVSVVLDNLFPPLPPHPVAAGESWSVAWTRLHVDGMTLTQTTTPVRLTYSRRERVGATPAARLEVEGEDGELEGYVLVGLGDQAGIVLAVSLRQTTPPDATLGAGPPYHQISTVELRRLESAP